MFAWGKGSPKQILGRQAGVINRILAICNVNFPYYKDLSDQKVLFGVLNTPLNVRDLVDGIKHIDCRSSVPCNTFDDD